ncbi:hypothetical protein LTR28_009400, partial [Elasticomyces elasticus]
LHNTLLLLRLLPLLRLERRTQRRHAGPERQTDGHRQLVPRRQRNRQRPQGRRRRRRRVRRLALLRRRGWVLGGFV